MKKSKREPSGPAAAVSALSLRPVEAAAEFADLWARSKTDFEAFLLHARASAAEPHWFAIPLSNSEDDEFYTFTFDVARRRDAEVAVHDGDGLGCRSEISVRGGERSLLIYGASRAGRGRELRVCMLSEDIDPSSIEVLESGPVLKVRVQKRRPGPPSPSGATP